MELSDYLNYWYDVYQGGYVRGATHAVDESGLSLCGRDMSGGPKRPVDGGYDTCAELHPSCKRCRVKLGLPKEEIIHVY